MIIERIKVIVDEFPKSCLFCSCAGESACYWDAYTGNVWHKITEKEYSKRPSWCPLEVETDGWIPVSERLPESEGEYLTNQLDVWDLPHIVILLFRNGEFGIYDDESTNMSEWLSAEFVTHWRPLPETPKESKNVSVL